MTSEETKIFLDCVNYVCLNCFYGNDDVCQTCPVRKTCLEIENSSKKDVVEAIFDTHGADSILNHRSGSVVEVVRQLTSAEADLDDVGIMYRIRFKDGQFTDAFEDELNFLIKE